MRINKYLASKGYATRVGADTLISDGKVSINGRKAVLGDQVDEKDVVTVKTEKKKYRYYAFNKPKGVITHSPQLGEKDVRTSSGLTDLFPVGRLDKDSEGLIILTDDGRITDKLLNPKYVHEKEYIVEVQEKLRPSFKEHMESGVDIDGYKTKKCRVELFGEKSFRITLTEGKKHQILRMCAALHTTVTALKRVRIMNIRLGNLERGARRKIEGEELKDLLSSLGL